MGTADDGRRIVGVAPPRRQFGCVNLNWPHCSTLIWPHLGRAAAGLQHSDVPSPVSRPCLTDSGPLAPCVSLMSARVLPVSLLARPGVFSFESARFVACRPG